MGMPIFDVNTRWTRDVYPELGIDPVPVGPCISPSDCPSSSLTSCSLLSLLLRPGDRASIVTPSLQQVVGHFEPQQVSPAAQIQPRRVEVVPTPELPRRAHRQIDRKAIDSVIEPLAEEQPLFPCGIVQDGLPVFEFFVESPRS